MDNVTDRYPVEVLDANDDDGTIVENVDYLRQNVVGRKIVAVHRKPSTKTWRTQTDLVIELDNGEQVRLVDTSDCCASTELESFLLHPERIDHRITGVGTTGEYTTWHIYADAGDVLELSVGWGCGNLGYYGYGFDIVVEPVIIDASVVAVDQAAIES